MICNPMPLFNYIAIDKEGKQKEGTLEVGSQNEAIARIKEMGFYPTQVAEVKDADGDDAIKKAAAKKGKKKRLIKMTEIILLNFKLFLRRALAY